MRSPSYVVVGRQELYRYFVLKKKEENMVSLRYPTTKTQVTQARAKVLYFIAGWLLSRVWKHIRKRRLQGTEWMDVVDSNKHADGKSAVQKELILRELVGEVERRNDAVNGAGLLFVTVDFFEFVYSLEVGYFHILSRPQHLGAYLGDLPGEMLRVVGGAPEVQDVWRRCCPEGADPAITHEVFMFILHKWHNCRMGDYTRRVSQVSSLSNHKGAVALRTGLKVVSGKAEKRVVSAGVADTGCGGSVGTGGAVGGGAGYTSAGGRPTRAKAGSKSRAPVTLLEATHMTQSELKSSCTKRELVELINQAAAQKNMVTRGNMADLKDGSVQILRSLIGIRVSPADGAPPPVGNADEPQGESMAYECPSGLNAEELAQTLRDLRRIDAENLSGDPQAGVEEVKGPSVLSEQGFRQAMSDLGEGPEQRSSEGASQSQCMREGVEEIKESNATRGHEDEEFFDRPVFLAEDPIVDMRVQASTLVSWSPAGGGRINSAVDDAAVDDAAVDDDDAHGLFLPEGMNERNG